MVKFATWVKKNVEGKSEEQLDTLRATLIGDKKDSVEAIAKAKAEVNRLAKEVTKLQEEILVAQKDPMLDAENPDSPICQCMIIDAKLAAVKTAIKEFRPEMEIGKVVDARELDFF